MAASRQTVHDELNRGAEAYPELLTMGVDELIDDLLDYCVGIDADDDEDTLRPHVQAWVEARQ